MSIRQRNNKEAMFAIFNYYFVPFEFNLNDDKKKTKTKTIKIRRKKIRYKMALRSKDLVCKTMAAPGFNVYFNIRTHIHTQFLLFI